MIPIREEAKHEEMFEPEMVWNQLKTVYDPEIPVNIVDLGLVYTAEIVPLEDGKRNIEIKMSMTAQDAAWATALKAEVEAKLARLPGVNQVQVYIVFDPPWNSGRMSEAAKLHLGIDLDFGLAHSPAVVS